MKNKNLFVSDFDGTISKKDFYWIVIDKYIGKEGEELYKKWQKEEIEDIQFLSMIFNHIGQSKEQIEKDILSIPLDESFIDFVQYLEEKNTDLIIVSAGMQYYIDILFEKYNLSNLKIYSNPGIYKEQGLYFDLDEKGRFFSKRYGIDKKQVVACKKEGYERTFYAGDTAPDFEPSLLCDYRFATGPLQKIFDSKGIDYYSFTAFQDIQKELEYLL